MSYPQRPERRARPFTGILVAFSLIAAGIGVLSLSQATFGVGLLAGACLLAIFARLAQAADYRSATQEAAYQSQQPVYAQTAATVADTVPRPHSRAWLYVIGGLVIAAFASAVGFAIFYSMNQ